ncbi:MAG: hypothetical protein ACT4TC_05925 [Myxococcaceae bacterium]
MRNLILSKRHVIALISAAALSGLTGCDEGSVIEDPLADPQNKEICAANYSLMGNLVLERPAPMEIIGCWPVGTWNIIPTLKSNTCAGTPRTSSVYRFKVTRTQDEEQHEAYEYLQPASEAKPRYLLKVTSGGGEECEGHLEIFSDTGTEVFNITASLKEDNSIVGFADYTVFEKDQWPY